MEEIDDDRLDLGDLSELLGFQLRLAQAAMHRDFVEAMGDLDFKQRPLATLMLIGSNPGVSQIALANTLGTDRATMMMMVDKLQDRGLLIRTRSTADRRRQALHLTPAGTKAIRDARRRIQTHEKKFIDLFTPAELKKLREFLQRISA
ncbi:hypothetical protein TMPK1_38350 [Rhodospirillales bacterium TMPK1]|uniref:HTH marR-type domain-containing protein n=1 Tax=Roseiterribacter gracilis TaxID=2812848 RepID=A0A8S8XC64_9PROT|nr:hypothetical protein TMPK1_38350 [Rhodospirillales bacterium TMPK1]